MTENEGLKDPTPPDNSDIDSVAKTRRWLWIGVVGVLIAVALSAWAIVSSSSANELLAKQSEYNLAQQVAADCEVKDQASQLGGLCRKADAIVEAGPEGPRGPIGPIGPVGPQGAQGPLGPQGVQGIQGIQGPQGDTGLTGAMGATGETGQNGSNGSQGPPGADGEVGPQGPVGPVGPVGPTGPGGATGDPGVGYSSVACESLAPFQLTFTFEMTDGTTQSITCGGTASMLN